MNFFEAQERARKSSRLLVWWFILSVIGVVAVMYFITMMVLGFSGDEASHAYGTVDPNAFRFWDPGVLLGISAGVGGTISLGSWYKLSQLSAGGKVVAQSLGGRQVDPTTTDLLERRLLNVVEEMAIASGVPVPGVWLMDEEDGINAFAAGTDPTNAVIGVTRGTLERLTRSELQGVVAHEFSHILNGDMRLNMRLMGWIFGLVMIALLGRLLLQSLRYVRSSRNSRDSGSIVLVILLAGLVVWVVGSIGVFFARILQAAISRQREYLADASAVQFTRNPEGIAGALKKIGGFSGQGKLSTPKAMEARHMFFAGTALSSLMATHPPLEKRILAIEPSWKGTMLQGKADPVTEAELSGAMGFAGSFENVDSGRHFDSLGDSHRLDTDVGEAIRGDLRAGNVTSFSRHEAKILLLGLLVAADTGELEMSQAILGKHDLSSAEIVEIMNWSEELESYSSAKKLALVDLSLSWLRKMNQSEARKFIELSQALIEADGQITLFEFMLQKVIERHVSIGLGLKVVPKMRYRKLVELEDGLSQLLGSFAQLGGGESALSQAAVEYRELTGRELPVVGSDLQKVAGVLTEMDAASPIVKQQILKLCALVVLDDGVVEDQELELLRATAEAIGAPVPPLVRRKIGQ